MCCVLITMRSTVLHDLRLVHTDLKPENILLVDDAFTSIPIRVSAYTASAVFC